MTTKNNYYWYYSYYYYHYHYHVTLRSISFYYNYYYYIIIYYYYYYYSIIIIIIITIIIVFIIILLYQNTDPWIPLMKQQRRIPLGFVQEVSAATFGPPESSIHWHPENRHRHGRVIPDGQSRQWKLAISKSVNSKSLLFRSQAESRSFDCHLVLTWLFRKPTISNYFACPVGLQNSKVRLYLKSDYPGSKSLWTTHNHRVLGSSSHTCWNLNQHFALHIF